MQWITTPMALVLVTTILSHPTTAEERQKPSLVEYLSNTDFKAFTLSADQNVTLEAIRTDPAAIDVQVGRASPDAVRDALAFSLVLPAPTGAAAKVTASFDNLNIEQRTDHDYSLYDQGKTPGSEVSLVVLGRDVYGTIKYNGKVYRVQPLGNGLTAIYRYDTSQLQDHPEKH